MAVSSKEVAERVDRAAKAYDSILLRLTLALFGIWGRWSLWRGNEVSTAAALSVIAVAEAQRRARSVALRESLWLLEEFDAGRGVDRRVSNAYPRFDTNAYDVWNRPSRAFRAAVVSGVPKGDVRRELEAAGAALKAGKPLPDSESAVAVMLREIERTAENEIQAAVNDQQRRAWNSARKVKYVRRIIHPELSRSGSCGMCVIAADRVYKKFVLQPIHERCKCETLPIIGPIGGPGDPGLRLNRDDLDLFYEAAGGNTAKVLKDVRFSVEPGGELGPVLVRGKRGEVQAWNDFELQDDRELTRSWATVARIGEQRANKLAAAGAAREMVAAHESMAKLAALLGRE